MTAPSLRRRVLYRPLQCSHCSGGGRAHRAAHAALGWQDLCCSYLTRLSRAIIAGNGPVLQHCS